ncbi:uncharacterized protein [Palaemon carinicauda]|uniref:uncharacterized protein n=1 Tax=Palaemon carinicauda TaxID=392227 RepID=UPI0035B58F01
MIMGHRLLLVVLLLALGATGEEDYYEEDYLQDYYAENYFTVNPYEEFAIRHAPFLRFHKTEGTDDYCFPSDAEEYYNMRDVGDWSRACNMNYTSIREGDIPTYWHAQTCGEHLHIAYWSFYGYNHKCDGVSGERDAWWEFIVVKIRLWETHPHMHEVMFGQKKGWYTRIPGNYELNEETHPVAYVGRASHGFYHDDGGSNTCCYFEDTRNPGTPDHWMRTWMNLVELSRNETAEPWMTDPGTDHWNGILAPTYRDDWDLCSLVGCTGSFLQVCTTCGCHKSDTADNPF